MKILRACLGRKCKYSAHQTELFVTCELCSANVLIFFKPSGIGRFIFLINLLIFLIWSILRPRWIRWSTVINLLCSFWPAYTKWYFYNECFAVYSILGILLILSILNPNNICLRHAFFIVRCSAFIND